MQQCFSSDGIRGAATLPFEIVLHILEFSAHSSSTQHARNVCLVSRSIYTRCWPSLHRIIALRTAKQLQQFSDSIFEPDPSRQEDQTRQQLRLKRRQDAIQYLYLNNNRDTDVTKELAKGPEMWMLSIILAARNLELLHVEEFWSISYPWESQEERPLLAYPLLLLTTHLATLHESLVASSESLWGQRMSSLRKLELGQNSSERKHWAWEVPQPREVTLSALAMLPSQLVSSQPFDAYAQLSRLHLYYAKMDELLIATLLRVPKLTHLRLTRPFSENLAEAAFQLLGGESGDSKIECLVVEAGIYMDDRTMARLTELQDASRGRLLFIDNHMLQRDSQRPPGPDAMTRLDESSSTTHVINWVTSSEERGFDQFARRARGDEGVWAR